MYRMLSVFFLWLTVNLLGTTQAEETTCREWEPVYIRIKHTPTQKNYERITLKTNVYDIKLETVTENRTYPEYNCDREEGDGSGHWHGFWTASLDEKPLKLSLAVRGISEQAARIIVHSDFYFKSRPRSWNAFKNQIREISADEEMGLPNLYDQVVVDRGKENAENLGYAQSESCHWEDVTRPVTVVKKSRKLRKQVKKPIAISFKDGLLLSNEVEEFNIGFDGLDLLVNPIKSMNKYEISTNDDETEYLLRAIERIRISPQTSAMKAALVKEDQTLKFKVGDTLFEELRALFPDSGVRITYEVVNTSTFLQNTEATGTINLSEPEATVDIKTHPRWETTLFGRQKALTPGKTYKIRFAFKRSNTETFNDLFSANAETSEVLY